jgi:hypothetical protein
LVRNHAYLSVVDGPTYPSTSGPLLAESGGASRIGRFHGPQEGDCADLSPLLEDAMQLQKDVPLELVVDMFQKMVSPTLLFLR